LRSTIREANTSTAVTRVPLLLACGVFLAASLPGCRTAETQPSPKELREITFRLNWFAGGEHAFLYYGKELGLFEEAGFNVNILSGQGVFDVRQIDRQRATKTWGWSARTMFCSVWPRAWN
jgi:ABC-type nitrate/sulfonate/bicarbonate transport system substrate-binding protein